MKFLFPFILLLFVMTGLQAQDQGPGNTSLPPSEGGTALRQENRQFSKRERLDQRKEVRKELRKQKSGIRDLFRPLKGKLGIGKHHRESAPGQNKVALILGILLLVFMVLLSAIILSLLSSTESPFILMMLFGPVIGVLLAVGIVLLVHGLKKDPAM